MKKSIIITTYNSSNDIILCLDSVRKNLTPDDEVFLIDNASRDHSLETIDQYLTQNNPLAKQCVIIRNAENVGFAKAINQGLRQVSGDELFLINPDTVFDAHTFSAMSDLAREKSASIVGVRHMNHANKALGTFGTFPTFVSFFLERLRLTALFPFLSHYQRHHLFSEKKFFQDRQVDWVGFGCTLITRNALQKVGLLDERFFMYFEDVDYCHRAHLSGLSVWYAGSIAITHDSGKSYATQPTRQRKDYRDSFLQYLHKQ